MIDIFLVCFGEISNIKDKILIYLLGYFVKYFKDMFCFVLVLLKIFVSFGKKRKLIEILEFRFKKVRVLFGLKLSFEYFLKILFSLTLVRKGVIFKRLGVGVEFLKFFLKRKFIVVF